MMLACREAFLTLGSFKFEPLVAFYQGLLNQPPAPFQSNRYAEFVLPGLRLGIFRPQQSSLEEFEGLSSGGMSLCLEVANLEDAIAHLMTLGYPPPGAIQTASHGREIYAYDPDGNRLILHQAHSPTA